MVQSGTLNMNNFYVKRVRRLTPVMLVVVSTVTLFDWVMGGMPIPGFEQLVNILKNYSFYFAGVHDTFYPDIVHRINNLWTLRWEWLFYLVLPLIAVLCRTWFSLTIMFIASLFILTDLQQNGIKNSNAALFLAFYLGMSLVHFLKIIQSAKVFEHRIFQLFLSPHGFMFVILLSMLTMFMPETEIRPQNMYFIILNAPVFLWFLLFSVYSNHKMNWVLSSAYLNLGRISYSLYLWHLFVTFIVYKIFISIPLLNKFYILILLYPIVVIFLSIPISILSYKYIELRFMTKRIQ